MRLLDWRVVGQLFLKASSLQRKRATLTVAAIAWGTVAIIMLLSFGEGLKIQLMKGRRGMGENIAVWWPDETSKVWQGLPEGRPIRPRMDDIGYLRGRMTAASGVIGEITSWSSSMTFGQTTITGRVTGWFFVGASLGGMFLPWLIGQLFESVGPQVTMLILVANLVIALGVYVVLIRYSTRLQEVD